MKWTCGRCRIAYTIVDHPAAVTPHHCKMMGCAVMVSFGTDKRNMTFALRDSLPPIAKQVLRAKEQLGAA